MELVRNYSLNRNIPFKGYDARALRGLLIMSNYKNLGNELTSICKKEGLDVFYIDEGGQVLKNEKLPFPEKFEGRWAQDICTFLESQLLVSDFLATKNLYKIFKLQANKYQKILYEKFGIETINSYLHNLVEAKTVGENKFKVKTPYNTDLILTNEDLSTKLISLLKKMYTMTKRMHISGGNLFIAKNKAGKELTLIGEDELKRFNVEDIKKMYLAKNIEFIPQMDFHLDMFMRPLKDGKVLVADDTLTLKIISNLQNKITDALNKNEYKEHEQELNVAKKCLSILIENFKNEIKNNKVYSKIEAVENKLTELGFEVVKVPGRYYYVYKDDLPQFMNFMNANVFLNKNNELVYITNSFGLKKLVDIPQKLIKKLDLSLEEEFYKYISPMVKREHTYFIKGFDGAISDILENYGGGIHCLSSEIPKV